MTDQEPAQVTVIPITELEQIYSWYGGQTSPQPCHLALDLEDGTLTASYQGSIGAIPKSVHERRTLWFTIPLMTVEGINDTLTEVLPIAQRIIAGYSIDWDGNNHVGSLDSAASTAAEQLNAFCEELSDSPYILTAVQASDWHEGTALEAFRGPAGVGKISFDLTYEDIARMAAEEDAASLADAATIVEGTADYFTAAYKQYVREQLEQTAYQLEETTKARNAQIRCLLRFEESTRKIGDLADLSHVAVQKIGKGDNVIDLDEVSGLTAGQHGSGKNAG